jgi:hypothetical protein
MCVNNSVGFLIAVFYENRDAAQMSQLQCEKIVIYEECGIARLSRIGDVIYDPIPGTYMSHRTHLHLGIAIPVYL